MWSDIEPLSATLTLIAEWLVLLSWAGVQYSTSVSPRPSIEEQKTSIGVAYLKYRIDIWILVCSGLLNSLVSLACFQYLNHMLLLVFLYVLAVLSLFWYMCNKTVLTKRGPHGSVLIKNHWIARDMCKNSVNKVCPARLHMNLKSLNC